MSTVIVSLLPAFRGVQVNLPLRRSKARAYYALLLLACSHRFFSLHHRR